MSKLATVFILLKLIASTGCLAQIPVITSFSPTSGPTGTAITITGANFNTTPANNIVFFGATQAMVTAATATSLTVTVPVGATYQYITVLSNSLVAYSSQPFVPTFAGGGNFTGVYFEQPSINFATGTSSESVAIGDLDGDGKADLAVVNLGDNTVSVLRNTSVVGTISYASKVDYITGSGPRSVAIGDLNGDGKAELVVANDFVNTVSVLRNTSTVGAISYAAKVDYITGAAGHYSVSIGDLDGDGRADIAVANLINSISTLRNTTTAGTISFASKVDFTTGVNPFSVVIGDLDGDRKPDMATANNNSTISVLRNTSVAGTINFAPKIDYTAGSVPYSLAIGDLDGDGKADLATANYGGASVSVSRNTSTLGNITYAGKVDYTIGSTGSINPYSIAIGDLNGDGMADMAASSLGGTGNASVLLNISTVGAISYGAVANYIGPGSNSYSVAIGDLDGDGKADMAMANGALKVATFRNIISLAPPSINSFAPTSGSSGTTVIITGTNFDTTPTNNIVKFNGTVAVVTASTSTSIATTVPSNATTGIISVTVGSNTTSSATSFCVIPPAPVLVSVPQVCSGTTSTITVSGGSNGQFRWYTVATGGTPVAGQTNSTYTTPPISTATTYYVSVNNSTCESARTSVLADVKICPKAPEFAKTETSTSIGGRVAVNLTTQITTFDAPLDLGSMQIITQPISGAKATIDAGVLNLDYAGILFSGVDILSVKACDLTPTCATGEIKIDVAGDITIFNAVSSNGDSKNDIFYIQYIDVIPETKNNKVRIFNRWGDNVFETDNYDNVGQVFRGQNSSGNELPSGVYFYKIDFASGLPTRTGYLSLKR